VILGEDGCRLCAVVDPAPTARAYAQVHGVPWFETLEALLEADRPDGVVIATPNALHVSAGLACVAAGVPALIEKPLADTLESALLLSRAAEAAAVPILVGHHRRHNPIIGRAREVVQSGMLGRLTVVTSLWTIQKPDAYFEIPWHREIGAGPVLINFIRDVDLLRFLCGEIESVQAVTSNAVRELVVEDTAVAILRFHSGALGAITVSDASVAPWSWELTSGENPDYPQLRENCYLLTGTGGSLAVPTLEYWHYADSKGWNEPLLRELLEVEQGDPAVLQMQHFCRVIRGEEAPVVTCADAAASLAAALALHAAARDGRPVSLDNVLARQN
jgi:predicted dehydrogenase